MYLVILLFHGRVRVQTSKYLVEQVRGRLYGSSARMLSMAANALLIQITVLAIPVYTMQAMKLPQGTIATLEKSNRSFFWGDEKKKKEIHSVAWETICQPKALRGLGIRRLREANQAYLTKLAWRCT